VSTQAPPRFATLNARTLPRQVARAIVRSILEEEFGPGDELPPSGELAAQFSVSRPVIREALNVVATLGMIESRQGRATRVTSRTSWDDLAPELLSVRLEIGALDDILVESLELRRVIETEAAALAALRATEQDVQEMRERFAALDGATDDTQAYMRHDVAFHDAVLRATHNRLFTQLIEQMHELLVLARTVSMTARPQRFPGSQDGHRAVLRAIEAHAPEEARAAMAAHLGWAEKVNVSEYREARGAADASAGRGRREAGAAAGRDG
jgi:GntR family transcriptional repressor for pyruvate dehydrogenase complex